MEYTLAKLNHIPEMMELWKQFIDYHSTLHHLYTRRKDGHLNFGKWVESLISEEDALVLVVNNKNHVSGYSIAQILHHPPVFEIEKHGLIMDMMIHPDVRRKGIGEKLLEKNFQWFRENDIYRVELNVAPNNSIGYNFWTKHGFKDYLHVMWKNI